MGLVKDDSIPHAFVTQKCELLSWFASETWLVLFALVEYSLTSRIFLLELGRKGAECCEDNIILTEHVEVSLLTVAPVEVDTESVSVFHVMANFFLPLPHEGHRRDDKRCLAKRIFGRVSTDESESLDLGWVSIRSLYRYANTYGLSETHFIRQDAAFVPAGLHF
jgi:hypothetical protein